MTRAIRLGTVAVIVACHLAHAPADAQYSPTSPDTLPNNYPPPLPDRKGPAPRLNFTLAGEIALPEALGDADAWSDGTSVYVPLASGVVRVAGALDARPEAAAGAAAPASAEGWVVAPDGRRRYRATREGVVEAQHKSLVRKRWVRSWMIVAPNATPAPPLLLGPRLCYAGLDDRVTCVRASNGDRLWSVDLGDRLSRPIACWPPKDAHKGKTLHGTHAVEGEILLVVPDNGASVVALDAYAGNRIAAYELPPEQNRFRSEPFVLVEGRIAVVRKGYAENESALTLLDLVPVPDRPKEPVPYNDRPTKEDASPGR
ncbi:MAG TPA: hypothetical protein VMR65_03350 [Candidatus Sulfotelmatobacter sp.]|nr:hypothetical protein [Candidatus Sulfotelmatobacter sp.]